MIHIYIYYITCIYIYSSFDLLVQQSIDGEKKFRVCATACHAQITIFVMQYNYSCKRMS